MRQAVQLDEKNGVHVLVCTVGKTVLLYDARCIDDLHAMLKSAGGWVDLGGAVEQKPAQEGTVEAWGRSVDNPMGGWYGLKKGLRGRFGVYIPDCRPNHPLFIYFYAVRFFFRPMPYKSLPG